MSAHEAPEPAPSPPTGFKPHHVAIWLGIGIAVFIVISGALPLITGWDNDNAIHREVFGGIPGPLQVAFYTAIPVVIAWASFRFAERMRNWERGRPAPTRRTRRTTPSVASPTSAPACTCAPCCATRPPV